MPNSSKNRVQINEKLLEKLNKDTVTLELAGMTTVSKINITPNNFINLEPILAKKLLAPSKAYLPYYISKNYVRLGPSVGILTSNKNAENPIPKGKNGRLYKEMINYAHNHGLFVFLFYAEGVNWKKKIIKGYTLNNNGKWISGNYGIPNIIYNRIQYRSIENRTNVKTLLERCANNPNVYVFNSRFLNKWEVTDALSNFVLGKKFLPETMKFNRTNLRLMIQNHNEVFLKPINSSRGQGIIKVIIKDDGSYQYSKAEVKMPKWFSTNSFYNLFEGLTRIGARENHYLIQEGVDLTTFDDRVYDLRAQFQKDGNGSWVITGVGVRIAGKNRFVTHVPNGGTAAVFEDVISKTFAGDDTKKTDINRQLKLIASTIPVELEKSLDINLAILSFDIGIDKNGKLWILEVNSKPASFDEEQIRFRHLQYLVDYFIYLAQINIKE